MSMTSGIRGGIYLVTHWNVTV